MLKIKKLSEKAKTPMISPETGALIIESTKITTEVGEDAKLVIVYHTDFSVEIPEGYVGIITPLDDIYKKSLTQTNSITIVDNNNGEELVVRFKTNTDVVPSVYKEGTMFAKMIIVPVYSIGQLEVEEFTSTAETVELDTVA